MSDQNTDTTSASPTIISPNNPALHKNMMQSELYTNAGFLALNIWDRFDIFCTLGTTKAYIKGSSNAFNLIGLIGATEAQIPIDAVPNTFIGNAFVELYSDSEFSWGIGARGALWECGCATLGAEFQYAQAKPDVSQINVVSNVAQFSIDHPKGFTGEYAKLPLPMTAAGKPADLTKAKPASLNYSEWQAGIALAYRLNFISPYIGIKWSKAKFDFDGAFIAQPQLETAKLNLLTWNPTLAGIGSTAANQDVLRKVSVTLNKLKSYRLQIYSKSFSTRKALLHTEEALYTRASSATTSSIDSLKLMSLLLSLCLTNKIMEQEPQISRLLMYLIPLFIKTSCNRSSIPMRVS